MYVYILYICTESANILSQAEGSVVSNMQYPVKLEAVLAQSMPTLVNTFVFKANIG